MRRIFELSLKVIVPSMTLANTTNFIFGLLFKFDVVHQRALDYKLGELVNPGIMPTYDSLLDSSQALTNERLSKGLSNWFHENVVFTHWEYISETGKGDSYLSELMRIRLNGKTENGTQSIQVILKNIPTSISRRLTFRSNEFFKNEINFYEIVLPQLLNFQSSKKLMEPFTGYAKVFMSHTDGENDFIILEDASVHNFRSFVARQEGIDLKHCKAVIKSLAQFHAISFALKDQEPAKYDVLKDTLSETYYAERLWDWYKKFWDRICKIAINAVEKEYPNTVYVDKIKEFAVPERYKDMIKAVDYKDTAVISHGDSWTNNFLFKYENNEVTEALIIDFQLSRCASPVLDLSFFICACTAEKLRTEHYDNLIEYYYDVLSTQIKEMGSDPDVVYSRELYEQELKKNSFFGLAFCFESMPMIVLSPEDAINMDIEGSQKININDVWRVGNYRTKQHRRRSADVVVHCVNKGYI